MPVKPAPLSEHLGGHFGVADALRSGESRRRLRAADLISPFYGTRRTIADVQNEEKELSKDTAPLARSRAAARRERSKALSFLPVMPMGSFICGRSAAVMRGYPLDPDELLDVGVIAPRRALRRRGVRGWKLEEHLVEVDAFDGILLSSPATTWAMLARELEVRQLVILGDAVLRIPRDQFGTQHPDQAGATLAQMREAVDAGRRAGVKKLRAALDRMRVGSSSPLETDYRLDAEDAGLPEPALDVEIRDARGRRLGISEFAYPPYRVVVEVEGDHHRTSKEQWNRDLQKYRDYAAAGWEVVRLTSDDIRRRRTAVHIVRDVLVRRGQRPSS